MKRVANVWTPKGVEINKKDKIDKNNFADYIINLEYSDITFNFFMNIFGDFNGKILSNPYDLLKVPAKAFSFIDFDGKEKFNKSEFTTTVGQYIFNIVLKHFDISKLVDGYWDEIMNKKKCGSLDQIMSYALMEDKISIENFRDYQTFMEWIIYLQDIISPNQSELYMSCSKMISKRKAELLKQHKEELDAGNIKVVEDIEKELIDYAREIMKDDPSIDVLDSGAGATLGNNFKNLFIMKGAIQNPDPTALKKYNIVTSNYMDGVAAEDYVAVVGSGANGSYSRGKKTETGGYWEKLFVSAYQHIKLDPKGSDCGTHRYLEVFLTDKNIDKYMYSYIVEKDGKLVRLDTTTRSKYLNKKVNFRFSSLCRSKTGICNMCAGDLLYMSSSENIGMSMSQIPSKLKLICMKAFHDSVVHTTEFDAEKAFYPWQ